MVGVPYALMRRWQFLAGYREGRRVVTRLAGGALARLSQGATIVGS